MQLLCSVLQCVAVCCSDVTHSLMHLLAHNDVSHVWNALQHTATHCNTLQHTATHCNTLHHTTTYCNALQYTATHCQHTATHYKTGVSWQWYVFISAFQCPLFFKGDPTHCNTLQRTATHCNTLQHTATHYNADNDIFLSAPFSVRSFLKVTPPPPPSHLWVTSHIS